MSLWLANHYQWHMPFLLVAGLALVFVFIGTRALPRLNQHLAPTIADGTESHRKKVRFFSALLTVLGDRNHRHALLFTALLIFSGFTVIPYVTLYAVHNVGIPQNEIPMVYLIGGSATFITARLIGRWADKIGKPKAYRILAILTTFPLLALTQAPALPLGDWLIITTPFFLFWFRGA